MGTTTIVNFDNDDTNDTDNDTIDLTAFADLDSAALTGALVTTEDLTGDGNNDSGVTIGDLTIIAENVTLTGSDFDFA